MKKLVVFAIVIAGLAFLYEPKACAGVSFAFGFPISIPSIEGPVVYDLYPYYNYLPGNVYYGRYWGSRYYYGRGYGSNGPFHFRYDGRGYYGGFEKRALAKQLEGDFQGALGDLVLFDELAPSVHSQDYPRLYTWLVRAREGQLAEADRCAPVSDLVHLCTLPRNGLLPT